MLSPSRRLRLIKLCGILVSVASSYAGRLEAQNKDTISSAETHHTDARLRASALSPKKLRASTRTIIPFKENWAFDPETNHLMGDALDNAWESLTARGDRLSTH